MKPKAGESYESWIERARLYEYGLAMQRIANCEDPDYVIQEMARRLMEKMLHPIYKEIRNASITDFDPEQDRRIYEERYLKNRALVPDQMDDNLFDNIEEN